MTVIAPKGPDEAARLQALRRYAILDTAPDVRFDRLVRLAQRQFAVPIALISLIDESRQWFKARIGIDAGRHGAADANPDNLDYEIPTGGPTLQAMLSKYAQVVGDPDAYCVEHLGLYPGWIATWP